jgi:HSP20 family protein
MVRRIKPVSRKVRAVARIRTTKREAGRAEPDLGGVTAPAVDVYETADAFIVEIELPGVAEKDVKVLLFSSRIEVSGFKRELAAHAGSRYMRLEREFGAFRRDVVVPGAIDPEGAFAAIENGVLTVVLKKPPRRRREVEIKPRRGGPTMES